MTPARILYVHSSDELYGADRSLLRLVSKLDRTKYEPLVVLSTDIAYAGDLSRELQGLGVETLRLPLGVLRRQYFSARGTLRFLQLLFTSTMTITHLIRDRAVDLVHSNTTAVWTGAFAAKRAAVPHVWHTREIYTQPRFLSTLMSRIVPSLSDRVIAVSQPVRQHLLRFNQASKATIQVIYNGIDPSPFTFSSQRRSQMREKLGLCDEMIGIGMIGRISAWKGQDIFVEAANLVSKQYPRAKFILVGGIVPGEGWRLGKLQQQIANSTLDGKVVIQGYQQDVALFLSALDIFILPSTRPDPFPTVVLEAMAAGLPVIATNHGGATEQVVSGKTGILVPPNEPFPLAEAMCQLLQDPERLSHMGQAGKQRLEENFTIESYIQSVQKLYSELL